MEMNEGNRENTIKQINKEKNVDRLRGKGEGSKAQK
jgi:hypothetical protein